MQPSAATVRLIDAKKKAADIREAIAKLTPVEKALGAKYLQPVLKLIESIEAI